MQIKNNERKVFHFNFFMKSSSEKASWDIALRDVIPLLQTAVAKGSNKYETQKGQQTLILRDIKFFALRGDAADEAISATDDISEATHVALLLGVMDDRFQDKVYTDMSTYAQRTAGRLSGENGEYTCHLLIELDAQDETNQSYYAMLENVPTLSRTLIVGLINFIVNSAHKESEHKLFEGYDLTAPQGGRNRQKLGYRPIVDMFGYASLDFIKMITDGQLKSIKLIKTEVQSSFGQRSYLDPQPHEQKFKVDKKNLKKFTGNVWEDIQLCLVDAAAEDWSAAEFTVNDGTKDFTVQYDLDTENFSQKKFVRSHLLENIDPRLSDASTGVVEHLCKRIIATKKDA
ncbi:hypothetical protein [Ponticaulis koreensis]|uniref:hypothetical protein n=1 Tax=Ponticaulis koreensis TaxID=1123045 RepID=UPI0003B2E25D|nr:hypothetical protein [Ponticaulis koreensis]